MDILIILFKIFLLLLSLPILACGIMNGFLYSIACLIDSKMTEKDFLWIVLGWFCIYILSFHIYPYIFGFNYFL
jgi:hypothetical protein